MLGGTSLLGGRGTFIGTLMGAGLSVQVLNATVFLRSIRSGSTSSRGFLIVAAALIYSQVRRSGSSPAGASLGACDATSDGSVDAHHTSHPVAEFARDDSR